MGLAGRGKDTRREPRAAVLRSRCLQAARLRPFRVSFEDHGERSGSLLMLSDYPDVNSGPRTSRGDRPPVSVERPTERAGPALKSERANDPHHCIVIVRSVEAARKSIYKTERRRKTNHRGSSPQIADHRIMWWKPALSPGLREDIAPSSSTRATR